MVAPSCAITAGARQRHSVRDHGHGGCRIDPLTLTKLSIGRVGRTDHLDRRGASRPSHEVGDFNIFKHPGMESGAMESGASGRRWFIADRLPFWDLTKPPLHRIGYGG
jgi:hypothetical protein